MRRLAMSVLWPAFMVAIAADGFFFSFYDPSELSLTGSHVDLSPTAAYSVGFFFFWAFCALSAMLSVFLMRDDVNSHAPF